MGCCRNNNVAGDSDNRKKRNNVAGASDNRGSCNDVAGAFDNNFKVPVKSYIDGEDFCRAVNRCNRVAAEEENNRRCRKNSKCHGWDFLF